MSSLKDSSKPKADKFEANTNFKAEFFLKDKGTVTLF